jgi:hypothetical protein
LTVKTETKIAFLRKFQVCRLAKRWQILRSNADFQTVSAFLHTLGRSLPHLSGRFGAFFAIAAVFFEQVHSAREYPR